MNVDYTDFRGYIAAANDGVQYFVIYLEGVGHIFVEHSGALASKIAGALCRVIS